MPNSKTITTKPLQGFLFGFFTTLLSLVLIMFSVHADGDTGLDLGTLLWALPLASAIAAIVMMNVFSAGPISWNEEGFKMMSDIPTEPEFSWEDVEGYSAMSSWISLYLLKAEGATTYQLLPFCYRYSEWKEFAEELQKRCPEKKAWIWLGPAPVRFNLHREG